MLRSLEMITISYSDRTPFLSLASTAFRVAILVLVHPAALLVCFQAVAGFLVSGEAAQVEVTLPLGMAAGSEYLPWVSVAWPLAVNFATLRKRLPLQAQNWGRI